MRKLLEDLGSTILWAERRAGISLDHLSQLIETSNRQKRVVQIMERVQKRRTPIGTLIARLKRIRLGVVTLDEGKTVKAKLERAGDEEGQIVKALGLDSLVPV